MKRLLLAALLLSLPTASLLAKEPTTFKYPAAPKSDQVDDYHGTKVADPYRPLENADSPESRAWIEAQNKLTFSYLKAIPERKKINDRLTNSGTTRSMACRSRRRPFLLLEERRVAEPERRFTAG
jgi:protease II